MWRRSKLRVDTRQVVVYIYGVFRTSMTMVEDQKDGNVRFIHKLKNRRCFSQVRGKCFMKSINMFSQPKDFFHRISLCLEGPKFIGVHFSSALGPEIPYCIFFS